MPIPTSGEDSTNCCIVVVAAHHDGELAERRGQKHAGRRLGRLEQGRVDIDLLRAEGGGRDPEATRAF